MSKVVISDVGYQTLSMLTRYMAEFLGRAGALSLAEQLIDICEKKLAETPVQFPICSELEMLGVVDYRQITLDKYKVLFRYDRQQNVSYIMAFMRQKQSAQQLLVNYALLN